MADTVEQLKEQIETAELAFGDMLSAALAFADNTTAAIAASEKTQGSDAEKLKILKEVFRASFRIFQEDMEQLKMAMVELVEKD